MRFDALGALGSAKNVFNNIKSGVNIVSNVASALNNLSNPKNLISALRKSNIPSTNNSWANNAATVGTFDEKGTSDWRVRLSLSKAPNEVYDAGTILQPIRDSGGLIFPYTPTITINHNATYSEQALTHQNYQFMTYQNSKVSEIQIIGDFVVQDWNEAKYWIAAVHFLRSVTKMYSGNSPYSGNPPPILTFNAYGDHVFKNVPVIVKAFSITLPKEVDYISVDIKKPAPGESVDGNSGASNTDKITTDPRQLSGLARAIGSTNGVADADLLLRSGAKNTKTSPSKTKPKEPAPSHVPTNSTLSVTIVPIYSRTQVREFNLKKFVEGGYVGGYL